MDPDGEGEGAGVSRGRRTRCVSTGGNDAEEIYKEVATRRPERRDTPPGEARDRERRTAFFHVMSKREPNPMRRRWMPREKGDLVELRSGRLYQRDEKTGALRRRKDLEAKLRILDRISR